MQNHQKILCFTMMATLINVVFSLVANANANELAEAVLAGKTNINLNLRYEDVRQENLVQDASALTLRTRLSFTTGSYNRFSATVEVEDTRIVLGQGDYTVGPTGYNPGVYSVIADPEHTELDQGYLQYRSATFSSKLGRQVLAWDNQRFVGHVGWRQDRQTFDALSFRYAPSNNLSLDYAHVTQRNRVFAQAADLDSQDHLFNGAYQTAIGKLSIYGYLLEVDNQTDNSLDTYGARFSGKAKVRDLDFVYTAEFASQHSSVQDADFETNYVLLEGGVVLRNVVVKLAYEILGSDEGNYGFSTPLATMHKFNGWADVFLATPSQGLVDTSLTLSGKAGPGNWLFRYHDYKAETSSETVADLGREYNLQYQGKFGQHYAYGIKYAAYSGQSGRPDTNKLWLWLGANF